jgi:hypothetical protein
MKKIIYISITVVLIGAVGYVLFGTQLVIKKSPKETVSFSEKGVDIKVVYHRPSKKGRLIYGEEKDNALVPYGKYWRLGANAATEITFSKDVTFGGKPVPAGSYRMYAVPGPSSFQISLNSELGVSSAHLEPNYSLDVVKVDAPVKEIPETETLTITFASDNEAINMDINWDKTQVRVPIIPQ